MLNVEPGLRFCAYLQRISRRIHITSGFRDTNSSCPVTAAFWNLIRGREQSGASFCGYFHTLAPQTPLLRHALSAGLDARAAAIVMRAVRNIVDTGRTIVCTIHQPSIQIFEVRVPCPPPTPLPDQVGLVNGKEDARTCMLSALAVMRVLTTHST